MSSPSKNTISTKTSPSKNTYLNTSHCKENPLYDHCRKILFQRTTHVRQNEILLDGATLNLQALIKLGKPDTKIKICPIAYKKIQKAREVIEGFLSSGKVVYGINTGFGRLSNTTIDDQQLEQLQKNLIMSHSTGVGEDVDLETTKRVFFI